MPEHRFVTPADCKKTPRHAEKFEDMRGYAMLLPNAVDDVQDLFDSLFQLADSLLESLVFGFQEAHGVPSDAGVLALAVAASLDIPVGIYLEQLLESGQLWRLGVADWSVGSKCRGP
jgi:hypothetical protein